METKIHNYGNNPITFALAKNNSMMVNATEMAKAFGKYPKDFLRNEGSNTRIDEFLRLDQ